MQTFLFILQAVMSGTLFVNKLLVFKDKKVGWLIGAFGTILATIYLWLIGIRVMAICEIGLLILMIYGYSVRKTPSPRVEWTIRLTTIATALVLTYFTFSGLLKIVECLASVFMIFGAYALTHKRKPMGWFFWLLCHIGSAWVTWNMPDQHIFTDSQLASALVALTAWILLVMPKR
jgi:hypothetical protein